MKRLTVGILLLMCVFLSGFFFHRGNQNREYDVSGMQPCIILNFLGFRYDSDNRAALERLLSLYSERHPDKFVSYEGIPPAEYGRVLSQRLKMKSADDVFMVPPILARRYAAEGRLAPLKGIPALKAYRPEVLEQMKLEGDIRYATTSLGAFGLFCNLDMLEKEGLSVPRNMAEFGAICGYFLRKEVTPVAFAGREPLKALVVAGLFEPSVSGDADSFFVSLETVPGRLEIALMESLDRLAALRERGWLRPGDVRGGDDGEPPLSFTRGETPFMLGGSWHAGSPGSKASLIQICGLSSARERRPRRSRAWTGYSSCRQCGKRISGTGGTTGGNSDKPRKYRDFHLGAGPPQPFARWISGGQGAAPPLGGTGERKGSVPFGYPSAVSGVGMP